jgi:hypothetical protein
MTAATDGGEYYDNEYGRDDGGGEYDDYPYDDYE